MTTAKSVSIIVRPAITYPNQYGIYYSVQTGRDTTGEYLLTMPFNKDIDAVLQEAHQWRDKLFPGINGEVKIRHEADIKGQFKDVKVDQKELENRIQAHAKDAFSILSKLEFDKILNPFNWPKYLKEIRFPIFYSIIVLILMILPISYNEIVLQNSDQLLKLSPYIVLLLTIGQYMYWRKISAENNNIRIWVLKLVIDFKCELAKLFRILAAEVDESKHAFVLNLMASLDRGDTFGERILDLKKVLGIDEMAGVRADKFKDLLAHVMKESFERKIQALASYENEKNYSPNKQGFTTLNLIINNRFLKAKMDTISIYILTGNQIGEPFSVSEGCTCVGFFLGLIIGLVPIYILLHISIFIYPPASIPVLILSCVVSLLSLYIPLSRVIKMIFRKRYLPRGLFFYEMNPGLIFY